MSALTEALRLAQIDHTGPQFVEVYEQHPYRIISLLRNGFVRERGEDDELPGELRKVVMGLPVTEAIHHLMGLVESEEELRTLIAPAYVWQHSGIRIQRQSGHDSWTIGDGLDFDIQERPDSALNLSEVRNLDDLLMLMGDDVGFCGGGHEFLYPEGDARELLEAELAIRPMRVTSSGVLLLPQDFRAGGIVPCWKANFLSVPNPFDVMASSAPQIVRAISRKHSRDALLREIQLNDPEADGTSSAQARRIDILLFNGNQSRTAVEVKVSRADFFRDTLEKRAPWMAVVHRFVYATPPGLVRLEEVPEGCGLWEVSGGAVSVVKKARINHDPSPLPQQVLVAMAYRLNRAGHR